MQTLLGYFLFSVLLRTGATFQCITCQKEGVSTCTSPSVNCNAAENACLKSLSEVIKDEGAEINVIMGCATGSHCKNQFIELSYGKGVYVRRQYDCCETDGCNPPSTRMPLLNTTSNGRRCPVCSLETGSCSDDAPLECTGSATHCFEAMLKDGSKKPVKGCTTEPICNILKTYKGPLIGDSGIQNVTCQEAKNASVSVPSGLTESSCSSLEVFLLALLQMTLFLFGAD